MCLVYSPLWTWLKPEGRRYREACPAQSGDFFELFAELDLLCALSTCPGGDLSQWGWGEGQDGVDMKECCRPLDIEVYELEDPSLLESYEPPEPPAYHGSHGMDHRDQQ